MTFAFSTIFTIKENNKKWWTIAPIHKKVTKNDETSNALENIRWTVCLKRALGTRGALPKCMEKLRKLWFHVIFLSRPQNGAPGSFQEESVGILSCGVDFVGSQWRAPRSLRRQMEPKMMVSGPWKSPVFNGECEDFCVLFNCGHKKKSKQ